MRTAIPGWRWAAAAAVAVLALAGAVAVRRSLSREQRVQRLPDGAELVLTRVACGTRNEFRHGASWEKLLGDLIPTNGIHLAWLGLTRPSHDPVFEDYKPQLVAEFKLRISRLKPGDHPLVRPGLHNLRGVVRGDDGLDYAAVLWPNKFKDYRDGCFGYVLSSCFPRDSKWLQLRIEQNDAVRAPWRTVASFTVRNPARAPRLPWVPRLPFIIATNGMEFALGEATVDASLANGTDPWPTPTLLPFQVRTNGLTLTNWAPAQIVAEDATGNWIRLFTRPVFTNGWTVCRYGCFPDPRVVWKLEVDFAPQSDFPPESLLTLQVPLRLATPLTTNFLGVPVAISWVNYDMLAAEIPTNAANLRLLFVSARDADGRDLNRQTGSWGQHRFWRALDLSQFRKAFALSQPDDAVAATIAIVPNVHASYLIQPKLIRSARAEQ
jgi:hypothetical protein